MNGQIQSSWRKYLKDLKNQGLTQTEIVEKTGRSKGMVSRAVKGVKDQRGIRGKLPATAFPTSPTKEPGNVGNADQKHIPHIPQGGNVGSGLTLFLLCLGFTILILFLLDRCLWGGKLFENLTALFETRRSQSIEKDFEGQDLLGLEGQDLSDLE